jgi:predicted RNase H-like nuclease (RuvC/YqgF family)
VIESYGVNAEATTWLGIDPGVTTGWALVDRGGNLVGFGELAEHDLRAGLDEVVRGCHRAARRVEVVIEKMPPGEVGRLSDRLAAVRATIAEVVTETYELPIHMVRPTEWKTSRVAKITRWPRPFSSQHAQDAATMALYKMDKEQRKTR